MDPLSTTASLIAIIQLSSEILNYIRSAAGAARDRFRLRNEIQACDDILQQIRDGADDDSEGGIAWTETINALEAPGAPLGRLWITLNIIKAKLQPKPGIKSVVVNLKWPFQEKEIDKLVAAVDREKTLLGIALTNECRKLSQAIHKSSREVVEQLVDLVEFFRSSSNNIDVQLIGLNQSIAQLRVRQAAVDKDKERRDIREWLTPIDYATQQLDLLSRRQQGTGQWFLNSSKYRQWIENRKQVLFCPGIPGAGKTILSAIVIDHLWAKFGQDQDVGLVCLFCNFQRRKEQTLLDLLSSLAKQLLRADTPVPNFVKKLYGESKGTRPSVDDLIKIIHSLTSVYKKSFIVMDALDECDLTEGCLIRLLTETFNLQRRYAVNILATSRDIPRIVERFRDFPSLEIRASQEDIQHYLAAHLRRLPDYIARNTVLSDDIIETISESADGMFLLAQIYLVSLDDKPTVKAVKSSLRDFRSQKGSSVGNKKTEVLTAAYDNAMNRIMGQKVGLRDLAIQVLSWITFAERQLTTLELQHALAVEDDALSLDGDNIPDVETMISVCLGLVTIDDESNIIRLAHYTTQQYLEQEGHRWFSGTAERIALSCTTYLSFDAFSKGLCQTWQDFTGQLEANPFLDYAARYWGFHAAKASTANYALSFLEKKAQVELSGQVLFIDRHSLSGTDILCAPRQTNALHLAAYFGLETIAELLITKWGFQVDTENSHGFSSLSIAADSGQQAVLRLLLNHHANVHSADIWGRTPLIHAASKGHETITTLLLDQGSLINVVDADGSSPLMSAVLNGYEAVVKVLLERGARVNLADDEDWTPLSFAASRQHVLMIKLLLDHGADVNFVNIDGRTPLSLAAEKDNERIVDMLLAHGSDANKKDNTGRTPAFYTAVRGHLEILRQFLAEETINWDTKDKFGNTPLSVAARFGHKEFICYLLANTDVDPCCEDALGRTAFWWAKRQQQADILGTLTEAAHENGTYISPSAATIYDPASCSRRAPSCVACMMGILTDQEYWYCLICDRGNFGICNECWKAGAHCSDQSHYLVCSEEDDF